MVWDSSIATVKQSLLGEVDYIPIFFLIYSCDLDYDHGRKMLT